MAAASVMRLFIAALLSGFVSGRLGSGSGSGEVEVPSYFGEAAVMPVDAASSNEVTEAPKLPILLTQASLEAVGTPLKEETVQLTQTVPMRDPQSDLDKVCQRTRQALSAQADGPAMPRGPVYKECMAALAPLRDHQQDSDAVDTLSDCMALVNALVANKGGDCHAAVSVMEASRKPPPAPVAATSPPAPVIAVPKPVAVAAPPPPKALPMLSVAKQEEEALDLVSEAMTTVCSETVRDAEVGIKSEKDAMKLANTIAPICQDSAQKHLGAAAATAALTKEWCQQLDGRLTIALETGFFFALAPVEAERQATEANPYASTTRRKFCTRFINSLRHQAQDGGLYLGGAPPPTVQPPATQQPAPAMLVPPMPVAAVAQVTQAPLPTLPPAPKAVAVEPQLQPVVQQPQPVAVAPVKAVEPQAQPMATVATDTAVASPTEKPPPLIAPKGKGLDMLRLVQALSSRNEWNQACTGLISRLTSEEGSVTEEYALGDHETADGTKVLTFNAADQGQVRKCAAQLKVLAIEFGVLAEARAAGAKDAVSLISVGDALTSADDAQALIDSPWAADACDDIAHGFLTARLAHPEMKPSDYCPLYSRDLQAMHAGLPPAEQAKQDLQKLRKNGLKRRMAQAKASLPQQQLKVAPAQPPKRPPAAALITEKEKLSNEDQDGMDFWQGLMQ